MGGQPLINLKKLRQQLDMTQKAFADSLGMSKTTYNNYETGAREAGHQFIIQIAIKYNVTADYLLGITDDPTVNYDRSFLQDVSEKELFSNFRLLNEEGQFKLVDYSRDLVSGGRYKKYDKSILGTKEA